MAVVLLSYFEHTIDYHVMDLSSSYCLQGCCDKAASTLLSLNCGFALGAPKTVKAEFRYSEESMDLDSTEESPTEWESKPISGKGMQDCLNSWMQKRAHLPMKYDGHQVHTWLLENI